MASPKPPTSLRRAVLVFTLGRLGLFGLTTVIVWSGTGLAGHALNGLTLLLAALLGSSLLAFVLLKDQREQFAQAIADSRDAKAAALQARRARLDDGPAT